MGQLPRETTTDEPPNINKLPFDKIEYGTGMEQKYLNLVDYKYNAIHTEYIDENLLITEADLGNNKAAFNSKNRYSNILPYKNTRVKLAGYKDNDIKSYINANYVNLGDRKYIATQGPLPHTIGDFWEMIWQQDTPVICMVTGLKEYKNNKLVDKCADYFLSENGSFNTDKTMTVSVVKTSTPNEEGIEDIEERTITLTKDGQTKTVQHLWFRVWPDHGVPENTETAIDLSNRIDKYTKASTKQCAPVIHCSAGIGRTGTIMAINYLLSLPNETFTTQANFDAVVRGLGLSVQPRILRTKEGDITWNPSKFVKNNTENLSNLMALVLEKMRRQRPQMIQGEAQYFFVYKTIQSFYSAPRYYVRLARNECEQRAIGNESRTHRVEMMPSLAAYQPPAYQPHSVAQQQPFSATRAPAYPGHAAAAPSVAGIQSIQSNEEFWHMDASSAGASSRNMPPMVPHTQANPAVAAAAAPEHRAATAPDYRAATTAPEHRAAAAHQQFMEMEMESDDDLKDKFRKILNNAGGLPNGKLIALIGILDINNKYNFYKVKCIKRKRQGIYEILPNDIKKWELYTTHIYGSAGKIQLGKKEILITNEQQLGYTLYYYNPRFKNENTNLNVVIQQISFTDNDSNISALFVNLTNIGFSDFKDVEFYDNTPQSKKSHRGGARTITRRTRGKSTGTQKRYPAVSKKTQKRNTGKSGNKTTVKSGAW